MNAEVWVRVERSEAKAEDEEEDEDDTPSTRGERWVERGDLVVEETSESFRFE
jgi:hypothetical protein